ncbi:MAG: hypothetical protein K0U36_02640 [Alphaproteobacteria bacterium]|nr:hypothetical protein [Alphaproteobacteria bacterium]
MQTDTIHDLRQPDDLNRAIDLVAAQHDGIKQLILAHGYPESRHAPSGYEGLLRSIVGQQISVLAAQSIWSRVLATDAHDPHRFLALTEDQIKTIGLSRAKAKYATALAEAVVSGMLDFAALDHQPEAAVIEQLTAIPGIGVWSAEIYCLFALGRQDVFPAGDLGVRYGAGLLFRNPDNTPDPTLTGLQAIAASAPSTKELIGLAEPFRPIRGALAMVLWHAINTEKERLKSEAESQKAEAARLKKEAAAASKAAKAAKANQETKAGKKTKADEASNPAKATKANKATKTTKKPKT